MFHIRPPPAAFICYRCQWHMLRQPGLFARRAGRCALVAPEPSPWGRRTLHASRRNKQMESTIIASAPVTDPIVPSAAQPNRSPIRSRLAQWQREFGGPDEITLSAFANHPAHEEITNNLSKLSYSSKADENQETAAHDIDYGEEGDDSNDLVTIDLFLKPGDVVELARPGYEPVLAVFVQKVGRDCQFFSVNGRWCHAQLHLISYAIPSCVDPSLLQAIIPYMPTNLQTLDPKTAMQIPREHGAPVQAVLRELTDQSERIYRKNAPVLDTAYSVLADTNRARMMTLAQIAKTLLSQGNSTWSPSPPALLAVRKALMHNEYRFRSDIRSHRLTNVFVIRPKNDVEVVETVHEWIREYNDFISSEVSAVSSPKAPSAGATHIADFIAKSRRLIALSRKQREPLPGGVGPSQSQSLPLKSTFEEYFTDTDEKIIKYFQAWVLMGQFTRMPMLHSACTSVLHAIGLYHQVNVEGTVTLSVGFLFLQEIGVVSPHESCVIYDEQLMLPTVRLSRNLEILESRAELTRKHPDFRDSMADFRRDWGAMTIFCVDSIDAQEIDDGVSIERIGEDLSEFWVHVHVANPTAFFDKGHVLSGLAAHMSSSLYTPERTYPMMPKWATQGFFSLQRDRPVITFSSRVDATGTVVESKVQHGIIRNVLSLTPDEVSGYLGEKQNEEVSSFVVGGPVPSKRSVRPAPALTPAQLQDLQDLYTVAKAHWNARKACGAFRIIMGNGSYQDRVKLWEKSNSRGLTWLPPSLEQARFVRGDPIVEVLTPKVSLSGLRNELNSCGIVSELMIMAGSSAASWCADRSVPIMFRGTVDVPQQDMTPEQFAQQVVEPYIQKHGYLLPELASDYLQAFGRATMHSSPFRHKMLGTPTYAKVTSPLRRFGDMLCHWQIEAAIRYELNTGQKLDTAALANASRPILPFSMRQIQEAIITLSPREKLFRSAAENAAWHWIVHAFRRALYDKEAPRSDTFKAIVTHPIRMGKPPIGQISDESIEVYFKDVPDIDPQVGDEFLVKVHHVDTFYRRIWVTPVELVHRMASLD